MEVILDEKTHTYTRNGEVYDSVTRCISKFRPIFCLNKIAEAVAKKSGVGPELIKAQWQQKAKMACDKGKTIHKILEEYEVNEIIPKDNLSVSIIKNYAEWKLNRKGKVFSEELVYSDTFKVAGTVDLALKGRKYVDIYDFKTNESVDNDNKYGKFLLHGLSHLSDTKYIGYALQLSLYGALYLELGYTPRTLGILWIDSDNNINEIPVPFLKNEAFLILQTHASY